MSIRKLEHANVSYFPDWILVRVVSLDGSVCNMAYSDFTGCMFHFATIDINKSLSIEVTKVSNAWECSDANKSDELHIRLSKAVRYGIRNGEFDFPESVYDVYSAIEDDEPYCEFHHGLDREPKSSIEFKETSEGHYVRA